jgi:hypothetical protein
MSLPFQNFPVQSDRVETESDERTLAYRNLAYHHFFANRPRASLETISAYLADATANQDAGQSLKALRWHVTREDSDFDEALAAMRATGGEGEILRYASWLMNADHVSEALDLMTPFLEGNIVDAMLLATECHLRMSDPSSASELFGKIEASSLVVPQLVHGYAHVQALLVLDGHRNDLRVQAIRDLEALPKEKAGAKEVIEDLLHALSVQMQDQGRQS